MYLITDNYGTRQTCWTWGEALRWLAAAAPTATIRNRFSLKVIARRRSTRVY